MKTVKKYKDYERSGFSGYETFQPWDNQFKIESPSGIINKVFYGGMVIKPAPNIHINIGDDYYKIPSELQGIASFIHSSRAILELEEDWNDDGALRIDKQTWITACKAIVEYSKAVWECHSVVIPLPEMNPCPDGSIDLVWRKPNVRLLINIKVPSSKIAASGYGDLMNNDQPIKIVIPKNKSLVLDHVAYWMKNL